MYVYPEIVTRLTSSEAMDVVIGLVFRIFVGTFVLPAIAAAAIAFLFQPVSPQPAKFFLYFLVVAAHLYILAWIARKLTHASESPLEALGLTDPYIVHVFSMCIGVVAFIYAIDALFSQITTANSISDLIGLRFEAEFLPTEIVGLMVLGLVPRIVLEEVLFRGLAFRYLERDHGFFLAAIVSSAGFAAIQYEYFFAGTLGIYLIVYHFLLGIFLCHLVSGSRTLTLSVFAHCLVYGYVIYPNVISA